MKKKIVVKAVRAPLKTPEPLPIPEVLQKHRRIPTLPPELVGKARKAEILAKGLEHVSFLWPAEPWEALAQYAHSLGETPNDFVWWLLVSFMVKPNY